MRGFTFPCCALIMVKERVLWWVEQHILTEVPRSIAQGMPVDNYKPFSKHSSAAHGDNPDAEPKAKQISNKAGTTNHGTHES